MSADDETKNGNDDPSFETFEEFLASVDEGVRELYNEHTSGLKSALEKERESRKELSSQVKSLLVSAEKGSKLEGQLAEMAGKLEESDKKFAEAQRRATFAEQAINPEVMCSNVKAAYALATAEGLFDEDLKPKWKELKEIAPELFKSGGTDAGNRSTRKLSTDDEINAAIRKAAFGR